MIKFIKWFFSPTKKEIVCDGFDIYDRLIEVENKIDYLIQENVGTTNTLYEIENKLDMLSSCQYNILNTQGLEETDV